jgi:hypothetical protein
METRFPISKEPNHAKIDFCWSDAVKTSKKATQTNIYFEKVSVAPLSLKHNVRREEICVGTFPLSRTFTCPQSVVVRS